ncbi:MAG: glycerophosphodiester phosphodiesterase [Christensenellales bacterium]
MNATAKGQRANRTKITAHSGCDGTRDNSREYIDYALKLDVDCFEVDVRRGKDGALILAHDPAEGGLPLADALGALRAHPNKRINLDFKEVGLEGDAWALARRMQVADQLIVSGTVAADAKVAFSRIHWYMNLELIDEGVMRPGYFAQLSPEEVSAIAARIDGARIAANAVCLNANHTISHTPLYLALRRLYAPISVWTPSEEEGIRRFLSDGVYNITTRSASLACALRKEMQG